MLAKIKPGTVVFELASAGCLNKDEACGHRFIYIPAQGLPAKYSAAAAAGLMFECILLFLEKNKWKN